MEDPGEGPPGFVDAEALASRRGGARSRLDEASHDSDAATPGPAATPRRQAAARQLSSLWDAIPAYRGGWTAPTVIVTLLLLAVFTAAWFSTPPAADRGAVASIVVLRGSYALHALGASLSGVAASWFQRLFAAWVPAPISGAAFDDVFVRESAHQAPPYILQTTGLVLYITSMELPPTQSIDMSSIPAAAREDVQKRQEVQEAALKAAGEPPNKPRKALHYVSHDSWHTLHELLEDVQDTYDAEDLQGAWYASNGGGGDGLPDEEEEAAEEEGLPASGPIAGAALGSGTDSGNEADDPLAPEPAAEEAFTSATVDMEAGDEEADPEEGELGQERRRLGGKEAAAAGRRRRGLASSSSSDRISPRIVLAVYGEDDFPRHGKGAVGDGGGVFAAPSPSPAPPQACLSPGAQQASCVLKGGVSVTVVEPTTGIPSLLDQPLPTSGVLYFPVRYPPHLHPHSSGRHVALRGLFATAAITACVQGRSWLPDLTDPEAAVPPALLAGVVDCPRLLHALDALAMAGGAERPRRLQEGAAAQRGPASPSHVRLPPPSSLLARLLKDGTGWTPTWFRPTHTAAPTPTATPFLATTMKEPVTHVVYVRPGLSLRTYDPALVRAVSTSVSRGGSGARRAQSSSSEKLVPPLQAAPATSRAAAAPNLLDTLHTRLGSALADPLLAPQSTVAKRRLRSRSEWRSDRLLPSTVILPAPDAVLGATIHCLGVRVKAKTSSSSSSSSLHVPWHDLVYYAPRHQLPPEGQGTDGGEGSGDSSGSGSNNGGASSTDAPDAPVALPFIQSGAAALALPSLAEALPLSLMLRLRLDPTAPLFGDVPVAPAAAAAATSVGGGSTGGSGGVTTTQLRPLGALLIRIGKPLGAALVPPPPGTPTEAFLPVVPDGGEGDLLPSLLSCLSDEHCVLSRASHHVAQALRAEVLLTLAAERLRHDKAVKADSAAANARRVAAAAAPSSASSSSSTGVAVRTVGTTFSLSFGWAPEGETEGSVLGGSKPTAPAWDPLLTLSHWRESLHRGLDLVKLGSGSHQPAHPFTSGATGAGALSSKVSYRWWEYTGKLWEDAPALVAAPRKVPAGAYPVTFAGGWGVDGWSCGVPTWRPPAGYLTTPASAAVCRACPRRFRYREWRPHWSGYPFKSIYTRVAPATPIGGGWVDPTSPFTTRSDLGLITAAPSGTGGAGTGATEDPWSNPLITKRVRKTFAYLVQSVDGWDPDMQSIAPLITNTSQVDVIILCHTRSCADLNRRFRGVVNTFLVRPTTASSAAGNYGSQAGDYTGADSPLFQASAPSTAMAYKAGITTGVTVTAGAGGGTVKTAVNPKAYPAPPPPAAVSYYSWGTGWPPLIMEGLTSVRSFSDALQERMDALRADVSMQAPRNRGPAPPRPYGPVPEPATRLRAETLSPWAEGRNRLLAAAREREVVNGYLYEYLVFIDNTVTPVGLCSQLAAAAARPVALKQATEGGSGEGGGAAPAGNAGSSNSQQTSATAPKFGGYGNPSPAEADMLLREGGWAAHLLDALDRTAEGSTLLQAAQQAGHRTVTDTTALDWGVWPEAGAVCLRAFEALAVKLRPPLMSLGSLALSRVAGHAPFGAGSGGASGGGATGSTARGSSATLDLEAPVQGGGAWAHPLTASYWLAPGFFAIHRTLVDGVLPYRHHTAWVRTSVDAANAAAAAAGPATSSSSSSSHPPVLGVVDNPTARWASHALALAKASSLLYGWPLQTHAMVDAAPHLWPLDDTTLATSASAATSHRRALGATEEQLLEEAKDVLERTRVQRVRGFLSTGSALAHGYAKTWGVGPASAAAYLRSDPLDPQPWTAHSAELGTAASRDRPQDGDWGGAQPQVGEKGDDAASDDGDDPLATAERSPLQWLDWYVFRGDSNKLWTAAGS